MSDYFYAIKTEEHGWIDIPISNSRWFEVLFVNSDQRRRPNFKFPDKSFDTAGKVHEHLTNLRNVLGDLVQYCVKVKVGRHLDTHDAEARNGSDLRYYRLHEHPEVVDWQERNSHQYTVSQFNEYFGFRDESKTRASGLIKHDGGFILNSDGLSWNPTYQANDTLGNLKARAESGDAQAALAYLKKTIDRLVQGLDIKDDDV